jgi:glutathione S-transferase
MSDSLVLYTNPMSRGRIARWMLEEVGAPYRAEILAYGPAMKTPAYLALNPLGKVPTLVHGAHVVTECAAICAYLAEAFPDAGLLPTPAGRGAYFRWLFFAAGPLEAALTNRALGVEVPPEKRGFVGYGELARMLDMLAQALAGDGYIAGERFSAADVYVGSQIGFGLQFGTIERRPEFEAYWSRVSARPAKLRADALDDAQRVEPAAG